MAEEMGIIKGVGYGMRDCSRPCLWFSVATIHSESLQVFSGEDADKIIMDANAYDIKQLNSQPCVVESEGMMMKFVRILKV